MLLLSLALAAFLLLTTLATVSQASASSIALSNFTVLPTQAAKGVSVTGSLTVQNLDTRNAVSVVVIMYDNGIAASDNSGSPTNLRKGESATVHLQFTSTANGPHCYAAQATPGPVTIGYCESGGHILGGTAAPINTLALVASAVGVASIAITATLAIRRRRIN